ncbi:HAD-like protein [Lophium mytilinum]|uniref:HAD-like protein n=1 Tax=Lophium mytilinum TaxID=390894 RepID=A0A6A6QUL0_9PEZI|nr:HAD-like protein [Lophium mytilinum]
MAHQTSNRPLTSFKVLSFDVYATLVDWETGIYTALGPLNSRMPAGHASKDNKRALLQLYTRLEGTLEHENPNLKYSELLGRVYVEMAKELDVSLPQTDEESALFGASVGTWPAFPDTVDALKQLSRHYMLVVLSNVDAESFERTRTGPLEATVFDAVYTAQQIGSYKPDVRNFEYMIHHAKRDLGVQKEDFLHTAQALKHDHVPAKKAGLKSCWIERAGDEAIIGGKLGDFGDEVELAYRYKTMAEMAEAVNKAFLVEE